MFLVNPITHLPPPNKSIKPIHTLLLLSYQFIELFNSEDMIHAYRCYLKFPRWLLSSSSVPLCTSAPASILPATVTILWRISTLSSSLYLYAMEHSWQSSSLLALYYCQKPYYITSRLNLSLTPTLSILFPETSSLTAILPFLRFYALTSSSPLFVGSSSNNYLFSHLQNHIYWLWSLFYFHSI